MNATSLTLLIGAQCAAMAFLSALQLSLLWRQSIRFPLVIVVLAGWATFVLATLATS